LPEDRFKIKTHRETREFPVHALTLSGTIGLRGSAMCPDASQNILSEDSKTCGALAGSGVPVMPFQSIRPSGNPEVMRQREFKVCLATSTPLGHFVFLSAGYSSLCETPECARWQLIFFVAAP